jgi:hypothetical protein
MLEEVLEVGRLSFLETTSRFSLFKFFHLKFLTIIFPS